MTKAIKSVINHVKMGVCGVVIATLSGPVQAQGSTLTADRLLDLMGLPETMQIMRDEGLAYADTLAQDMLPSAPGASWDIAVSRLYDLDRMETAVRSGFVEAFAFNSDASKEAMLEPLVTFFASETGRDVIRLEVSARRAMSDEAIEEAARAAYRDVLEETPASTRLMLLETLVTENSLVDANVVSGMNSSVQFYQGLADGDAIDLSEADILAQVWGSEEDSRRDTTEWLFGYFLMAYGPLSDDDMTSYVELLSSPEGRAMNNALFAGFDDMFAGISYGLGLAIAREMQVEEL